MAGAPARSFARTVNGALVADTGHMALLQKMLRITGEEEHAGMSQLNPLAQCAATLVRTSEFYSTVGPYLFFLAVHPTPVAPAGVSGLAR